MVNSSDTTTSPLIERLRLRKMEAELQAEIAASEAKLAKLELDTSKAPENKVTIEGETPAEAVILAYRTLSKVADRIADEFDGLGGEYSRVMFLNGDFQKSVLELGVAKRNMGIIHEYFSEVVKKATSILEPAFHGEVALSTLAVAGAAANSALELSTLFRVERSIKYSKLDIDNEAVVSAVAGALQKKNIEVYDPSKILAPKISVEDKNSISSGLVALRIQGKQLLTLKDRINAEKSSSSRSDEARLKVLEATLVEVTNAIAEIDASVALFVKPDEATGLTAFARLLEAEQLAGSLEKTALLSLRLVSLMGGTRSKRGFFSSSLAFSGGCVVSFTFSETSGKVLASAVIPAYSGYLDANELPQSDGLKGAYSNPSD